VNFHARILFSLALFNLINRASAPSLWNLIDNSALWPTSTTDANIEGEAAVVDEATISANASEVRH